jgi:predicted NBD/HSP70 family sugar kinase
VLAARPLSVASLDEAARAGDPVAARVVEETARWLALGVTALLNVLNPSLVILGGGMARLGETLLGPLRRFVHESAYVSSAADARIVASPLAERAIALGAATRVLENALGDLALFPTARGAG